MRPDRVIEEKGNPCEMEAVRSRRWRKGKAGYLDRSPHRRVADCFGPPVGVVDNHHHHHHLFH